MATLANLYSDTKYFTEAGRPKPDSSYSNTKKCNRIALSHSTQTYRNLFGFFFFQSTLIGF